MSAISPLTCSLITGYYRNVTGEAAVDRGEESAGPLAELVEDGTIYEEQEESIRTALEAALQSYRVPLSTEAAGAGLSDTLDGLVDSGVITGDQRDAVAAALEKAFKNRPPMPPGMPPELEETLSGLVEEGTLTDAQADAVLSALQESIGTPGEISESAQSVLDALIEAGTVTGDEADAVAEALFTVHFPGDDGKPADPLEALVEAGTLTGEQLEAVRAALQSSAAARKADAAYDSVNEWMRWLIGMAQDGESGSNNALLAALQGSGSTVDVQL